jgi:hypothetical protein
MDMLIGIGSNKTVTDSNKDEYVQLLAQLKLSLAIKDQLNAFLQVQGVSQKFP